LTILYFAEKQLYGVHYLVLKTAAVFVGQDILIIKSYKVAVPDLPDRRTGKITEEYANTLVISFHGILAVAPAAHPAYEVFCFPARICG